MCLLFKILNECYQKEYTAARIAENVDFEASPAAFFEKIALLALSKRNSGIKIKLPTL